MRIRTLIRRAGIALLPVALLAAGLGVANRAGAQGDGAAWLGVYSQALTDELRDEFRHDGDGVLVTRVVRSSPAERAGLQRGDVIVGVGGTEVASPSALTRRIRDYRPGQYVVVKVMRDGRSRTFNVRLGNRADADPGDEARGDLRWTPAPDAPDAPAPPRAPKAPGDRRVRIELRDGDDVKVFEGDEGLEKLEELHGLEDLPRMMDLDGGGLMLGMLGRGRLGVRVETLSPGMADYFSGASKGALVMDVTEGSAAEKAGLRAGDVITRFDGTDVEDADDLISAVRRADAGAVSITVVRRGSSRTIEAELEKADARAPRAFRYRNRLDEGTRWWDGRRWHDIAPRIEIQRERRDELRREMEELKRELEELRRELRDRR